MKKQSKSLTILMLAGAALLIGCAAPKPFEYHSGNEIPKGPGLFSKEKGEFTLYEDSNKAEAAQAEPSAPQSPEKAAGQVTAPASRGTLDEAEFREFQEWRKDQKEFEAFQQWKRSGQGSADYEEFREWKRWQEYKKWQESKTKDR